ncbi:hypothetical protein [Glycomyces rhizosphaerae]|uniref:Nucleotidyl transferase AbiEii/AbiGii toxin family protein n=1 Tax=Glycomyces rhizosphaerae TaxID=2054422 RepID=A0ABV7Q0A7_9ACTN
MAAKSAGAIGRWGAAAVNRVRGEVYNGFKLIELLRSHVPLDFDPDDFLIAGSARLWAGGITSRLSDLDLVARPGSDTWRRAQELAFTHALVFDADPLRLSDYTGDKIARLYSGVIEVSEHWILPGSDTEMLLERAEVIDGLKYLPLTEVIAYKHMLSRPKDLSDLQAIDAHLDRAGPRPHLLPKICDAVIQQHN